MIIKPIETLYKGYRFRSRLEARWAIFFDVANIKWEYETEGFNVNNTRYLPDFYLPELKIYVEVKPNGLDIESRVIKDVKKAKEFITWGSPIRAILFLSNIPYGCEDGGLWHFPCLYYSVIENGAVWGWWYFYDHVKDTCMGKISKDFQRMFPSRLLDSGERVLSIEPRTDIELRAAPIESDFVLSERIKFQLLINTRTFEALRRARGARFEHGEHGL